MLDPEIGTYTVGSVDPNLAVGDLVVPDQLIDYTWGRLGTYDDAAGTGYGYGYGHDEEPEESDQLPGAVEPPSEPRRRRRRTQSETDVAVSSGRKAA